MTRCSSDDIAIVFFLCSVVLPVYHCQYKPMVNHLATGKFLNAIGKLMIGKTFVTNWEEITNAMIDI